MGSVMVEVRVAQAVLVMLAALAAQAAQAERLAPVMLAECGAGGGGAALVVLRILWSFCLL